MTKWLKANSNYKLAYASFCLVLGAVISFLAGYDYRSTLITQSPAIVASYGEFMIWGVLTLSGLVVLILSDRRINMLIVVLMAICQLGGALFCKDYCLKIVTTVRLEYLHWLLIFLPLFTFFLYDSPKKYINKFVPLRNQNAIKAIVFVFRTIIGFLLILYGVVALFQCGCAYADPFFVVCETINPLVVFLAIGLVMIANGSLIICTRQKKANRIIRCFIIITSLVSVAIVLIQRVEMISWLVFYIVLLVVTSVSEFVFTILEEKEEV